MSGYSILAGSSSVGSVPELVAHQAASRPDAVALNFSYESVSYNQLEERSSALANVLRSQGVGSESVVGLCAKRSPAMVIGALAIMKAGGAYLPLDPLNPPARLAFMAKDAQISALVVGRGNENKISGDARPTIVLDDFGRIIDSPAAADSRTALAEAAAKKLAYVIYTSGTTGDPNGVEVTHENLLNLISWHQQAFQVTHEVRASQIANVGFDAAVWEVWPYLTAGAAVHIPHEEVTGDPESLRNWLVTEGITISFVPTPIAEQLLRLTWPEQTSLRIMLTGADTLRRHPPQGLPFQLVNNYGPTECTVVATSGRVHPDGSEHRLPPIGTPIAKTKIYILDESGQQVPFGAEGELHIGGAGVARGYRNRPELTASRFVLDPFSARPGGLLFKTGDVARQLPDGQIAFVRRMDDQVKVRGFRVEPNEITAVLNGHPGVQQSVVVARETGAGEKRLVGYVVIAPDNPPTLNGLHDFLRARLPDYMVPEKFVRLETMPLSANGKINRPELPAPSETNILQDPTFTAPRTDLEKSVANILAVLLGVERVDVEANFFVLGGHSLLGAQLIARIRRMFGVEIGLRVLFEAPTVAELAAEIERLLVRKLEGMNDAEVQRMLDAASRPDAPR